MGQGEVSRVRESRPRRRQGSQHDAPTHPPTQPTSRQPARQPASHPFTHLGACRRPMPAGSAGWPGSLAGRQAPLAAHTRGGRGAGGRREARLKGLKHVLKRRGNACANATSRERRLEGLPGTGRPPLHWQHPRHLPPTCAASTAIRLAAAAWAVGCPEAATSSSPWLMLRSLSAAHDSLRRLARQARQAK